MMYSFYYVIRQTITTLRMTSKVTVGVSDYYSVVRWRLG